MSRLTTHQNILNQGLSVPEVRSSTLSLPGWVLRIPGVSAVSNRLGAVEFRRRLVHMSPALLPIGLPFIPHNDVWGPPLMTILVLVTIIGLAIAFQLQDQVKRTAQDNWSAAVYGYVIPIISALLLFPGRAEIGLMTLQIIALGDGSATFGGLMIGGRRLPWNSKKTFSGLLCFTIVGSIAATYSYWGEARPGVPVVTAYLICFASALAAAIVESLPIRSNDNLRVGITALLMGLLMTSILT